MLFPNRFFIYNYSKELANQSSFNTITIYIYLEGFCVYMFVCEQRIFCFENTVFIESLFAVSQFITFVISRLTGVL